MWIVKVDGLQVKADLEWFSELLGSCYGPWSGQALLLSSSTNTVAIDGGAVTLTRRSLKLLQLLKTDSPLLKNVILHLQGHAHCYRDSTLYAGMLACK